MAEIDDDKLMQIGQLLGEFKHLHERFNALEGRIQGGIESLHTRITDHEKREEPRLQKIERLIWIGVGGVLILSFLLPFGLSVVQKAVAQAIAVEATQ